MELNRVYSNVFRWMFMGVMTTALFAIGTSSNKNLVENIAGNNLILLVDILFLLVLTFVLANSVLSLSRFIAKLFFFAFSGYMGLTLSLVFEIWYGASLGYVFLVAALGYGILSQLYRAADASLSDNYYWITFMLFTFPATAVLNFVWFNDVFYWVVSMLIQSLLTAVLIIDTRLFRTVIPNVRFAQVQKSVLFALLLHIDIINLFFLIVGITTRPDFEVE